MLKGKRLLEYTNLFSPNENEKNDKIILKYFQWLFTINPYNCLLKNKIFSMETTND